MLTAILYDTTSILHKAQRTKFRITHYISTRTWIVRTLPIHEQTSPRREGDHKRPLECFASNLFQLKKNNIIRLCLWKKTADFACAELSQAIVMSILAICTTSETIDLSIVVIAILCYDLFAVPCFIITNLRLYIYMLVCLCTCVCACFQ